MILVATPIHEGLRSATPVVSEIHCYRSSCQRRTQKGERGFDGGQMSSDRRLLLLREVSGGWGWQRSWRRACRIARTRSASATPGGDAAAADVAIAAGYEDADDCDGLRHDRCVQMAVGRCPESGEALCSQPTISRLETRRPDRDRADDAGDDRGVLRELRARPASIVLDIDDTLDRVHGQQQLSFFNAHYDERCFLPIHI